MAVVSYGRRIDMLAEEKPEARALTFLSTNGIATELSRDRLAARSSQVARHLGELGVHAGSYVAIGLPNCIDHVVSAIATWKLGATPVPIRHDVPEAERSEILKLVRPATVIADWTGCDCALLDRRALKETEHDDAQPLPDQTPLTRFGICSGGSTGRPKLILDARPATIDLETFGDPFLAEMGWCAGRTHLVAGPLYHANGFSLTHLALMIGQHTILLERFNAAQWLDAVEQYRVNCGSLVPTMMFRLLREPGIRKRDLSSIESIYHGGASCAGWLKRGWIELLGPKKIYEGFGSTEAIGETLIRGDEWLAHPGSVGRGVYCDIRILDTARNDVPTGTIGEIFMRWKTSQSATYRYVGHEPAETTPDGFTSVGDMGWIDAEGYLYVADRRTDMIISGGANIYPAEVEAAILQHPGIIDAAVVGLPDEEWGKRVHAIVVPADQNQPPTASQLDSHCRKILTRYKVPKSFEFVSELPRNEIGKIRKVDLVAARAAATPTGASW